MFSKHLPNRRISLIQGSRYTIAILEHGEWKKMKTSKSKIVCAAQNSTFPLLALARIR